MALKSWNFETNELYYDEKIYDKNKRWVRIFLPNKQFQVLKKVLEYLRHFNLSEDKNWFFNINHKTSISLYSKAMGRATYRSG